MNDKFNNISFQDKLENLLFQEKDFYLEVNFVELITDGFKTLTESLNQFGEDYQIGVNGALSRHKIAFNTGISSSKFVFLTPPDKVLNKITSKNLILWGTEETNYSLLEQIQKKELESLTVYFLVPEIATLNAAAAQIKKKHSLQLEI